MIRLRIAELMAEKAFREGRRIEWQEVATVSGIHRVTLSKMRHQRGYNATLSNVDLLCRYFGCAVADLLVYVPDEELSGPVGGSFKGPVTSGRSRNSKVQSAPVLTPRTKRRAAGA